MCNENSSIEDVHVSFPTFDPGKCLGQGVPFVVSDSVGRAWRIDPVSGLGSPVKFGDK